MNKKNLLKFILDLCMIIVLALMYNKMSISMSFHEIGGLALLGVMLIHILLNGKWVITITKKIFNKSLPAKVRLGYIINTLLLISFALIGISGIFISKVVFHISNNGTMQWKTIHYTSSAIALLLMGIHLGLHTQFISSMIKKLLPLPRKIGNSIAILFTIIIFSYGCYSMATSNFSSWLLMPLHTQQGGGFEKGSRPDFIKEQNEVTTGTVEKEKQISQDTTILKEEGNNFHYGRDGKGKGREQAGAGYIVSTLTTYFSIVYVFAMVVALLDTLINRSKRKKLIAKQQASLSM